MLKLALVANNASTKFGGESYVPYHFFRQLFRRGIDVHLFVHERVREDLKSALSAEEFKCVHFASDCFSQKVLDYMGRWLPNRIRTFTTEALISLLTEQRQKPLVKACIKELGVNLIHQPIPVSPKLPSTWKGLGVPVVMGPMNGGMQYPPAFKKQYSGVIERLFIPLGRAFSGLCNRLIPGKLEAATLLVANERSRQALPVPHRGVVEFLVENGIDCEHWDTLYNKYHGEKDVSAPLTFLYSGALVECKAVDLLIQAFHRTSKLKPVRLLIAGEGSEREKLERQVADLGLERYVHFLGWLSQEDLARQLALADVYVFPSLRDCGGAAVLEAMAMRLPVIAANWGGPADYLTNACGILIEPSEREAYVQDLARAMDVLAEDNRLRSELGERARMRVEEHFSWEKKLEELVKVYERTVERCGRS